VAVVIVAEIPSMFPVAVCGQITGSLSVPVPEVGFIAIWRVCGWSAKMVVVALPEATSLPALERAEAAIVQLPGARFGKVSEFPGVVEPGTVDPVAGVRRTAIVAIVDAGGEIVLDIEPEVFIAPAEKVRVSEPSLDPGLSSENE
jgi:hypothetical protein